MDANLILYHITELVDKEFELFGEETVRELHRIPKKVDAKMFLLTKKLLFYQDSPRFKEIMEVFIKINITIKIERNLNLNLN